MTTAHPLAGPDVYTVIELAADQISELSTDERWLEERGWDGAADERLELQHRSTVVARRRPLDDFEAEERILTLLATVSAMPGEQMSPRASTVSSDDGRPHWRHIGS